MPERAATNAVLSLAVLCLLTFTVAGRGSIVKRAAVRGWRPLR
ncbi:hypothetical protein [Streptomyces xinghaiensis]